MASATDAIEFAREYDRRSITYSITLPHELLDNAF
jgi:hypothetical protein